MTPPGETPAAPDDGRSGRPFTLRLKAEDRKALEHLMFLESQHPFGAKDAWEPWHTGERRSLGAFMVWAAKQWRPPGKTPAAAAGKTRGRPGRRRRPGKTSRSPRRGPKRAGRKPAKRAPKRKRSR